MADRDTGADLSRKDASAATIAAQRRAAAGLPEDDGADFALARKGFLGTIEDAEIPGAWSMKPYAFLEGERLLARSTLRGWYVEGQ